MATKTHRLARLFGTDGKCLIVAMDHAGFMDKPQHGLEHPEQVIQCAVSAGADAFLLTLGSTQRCASAIGRAGVWLSVDAQPPVLERIVETALQIGADGIKCMVYPWWDQAPDSLTNLAALAAECLKWGMPLMAEVIPGGFTADPNARTPEKISAGARVAMEAGADVIKTFYTGDADSFQIVTQNCPVPIIVLGGEKVKNDEDLLANVRGALAAGAAGVAIGRNIWGHAQPEKITRALASVIHASP
ncbi:MAG: fructose-bisphosphate aldolase [Chloroflexi bacterium]|nr:fructose-bisphosphate aldolase [Chloroflexota bacterium]